ncbi:MAG: YesL family protein [Lachnospiraceae bacterium]|nr:YesL family protein [Lachnospiraceae bacterium]MBQ7767245.1 YesL family protein [Lachnospiraceae bacterium]
MRKWLFDLDSPLIRGLSRIFDCMLLSILTILCSLPIVTVGAAVSACYDVMIRMALDRDNGIIKPYFKAFAKNFKKGTVIWLICMVGIIFIGANYYLLSFEFEGITEGVRSVIMVIVLLLTVLMGFVLIYVFPLQARYENKVGTTLKNALFISIVQFPRSIGLLVLNGVVVVLGAFAPAVIPLLLFVEFSAVTYFTATRMIKVFVALGDEDAKKKPADEDDFAEETEADDEEESSADIKESDDEEETVKKE